MAKAVTLKNNNDEEVYPVTDLSLVNGNIPTGRIADNAVTSDKIDWTTTGGMKLLATVPLSSFGTSDSSMATWKVGITVGTHPRSKALGSIQRPER